MEIEIRKYYKFRYGNKLYTRREAGQFGKTFLTDDGNTLFVINGSGWHCSMYLVECARGQKYYE